MAVTEPLARADDLLVMWPSLDTERAHQLIAVASRKLRQKLPSVDERIALPDADSRHLDDELVADVIVQIVCRYLNNTTGAASRSKTIGPYQQTESFTARNDYTPRGQIVVLDSDLSDLSPPAVKGRPHMGTLKASPRLAPAPFGAVGDPAGFDGSKGDAWLAGGSS